MRFLDHANRKIDGFIRAKRKLIALLGEQKQAIIHRAVTRGLNPNAPLKPSGIPWLGDIPKHWEVSSFAQSLARHGLHSTFTVPFFETNPSGQCYRRFNHSLSTWSSCEKTKPSWYAVANRGRSCNAQ